MIQKEPYMQQKAEEKKRDRDGDLADNDVVGWVVGGVSFGGLFGGRVALRVAVGRVLLLVLSLSSPRRHSLRFC